MGSTSDPGTAGRARPFFAFDPSRRFYYLWAPSIGAERTVERHPLTAKMKAFLSDMRNYFCDPITDAILVLFEFFETM